MDGFLFCDGYVNKFCSSSLDSHKTDAFDFSDILSSPSSSLICPYINYLFRRWCCYYQLPSPILTWCFCCLSFVLRPLPAPSSFKIRAYVLKTCLQRHSFTSSSRTLPFQVEQANLSVCSGSGEVEQAKSQLNLR